MPASPDKWRRCPAKGLEAALNRAGPQRGPGMYWLRDALDFLGPEVLKLEQIAEELPRALRDDDCVWLGNPLQTCRKVRRIADDASLLCLS